MICDDCKRHISTDEAADGERPFPAFTVAGGLVGSLAAAATGTLLIVPAAVVAGAALDVGRRCSACGTEIGDEDEAYYLMEEMDDGVGARSYRAARSPASADTGPPPQQGGFKRSDRFSGFPPCSEPEHAFDPFDEKPEDEREATFVFDEVEGRLLQKESVFDTLTPDAGVRVSLEEAPGTDPATLAEDLADGFLAEPEMGFDAGWQSPADEPEWFPQPPEPPTEDLEP